MRGGGKRRRARGDNNMTQMHFARKGQVTEEMLYVAGREKISPELVRSRIAEGKLIIPANINHPELEPMCIGVDSLCKINANIGNSAVTSNVQEELKKLHTSVHYGADTDDGPVHRRRYPRHPRDAAAALSGADGNGADL